LGLASFFAGLLVISGWAKRQVGDLETAELALLEVIQLDTQSGRGFFGLGHIYHAKGHKGKVTVAHCRALTLVFAGRSSGAVLSGDNSPAIAILKSEKNTTSLQ
jgi:hypothetical protein